MKHIPCALLVVLSASIVQADTIKFSDGTTLDRTVVQQDDDRVAFLLHFAVMQLPRSSIQEIVNDTTNSKIDASSPDSRTPNFSAVAMQLGKSSWAAGLHQIPATVIDTGVMRNVPYKSLNAGRDYEINVYGDPISPVDFEVGVRGSSLVDDRAKQNCIDFMCSLLPNRDDQATIRGLKLDKDLVVRNGLTFEITPPTADDAYGGWWVSAYSELGLNSVRATDKELQTITVPKSSIAAGSNKMLAVKNSSNLYQSDDWNYDDMRYACPTPSTSSDGSVYVRGYYRKDGTYVHSYTRSAPHNH